MSSDFKQIVKNTQQKIIKTVVLLYLDLKICSAKELRSPTLGYKDIGIRLKIKVCENFVHLMIDFYEQKI